MEPQVESDLHLVLQARSGNTKAYERIVVRHQAAVCATAYAVLRDTALSEDIGQEAFVTGWRKLGHVREPDKLGSWLCGIARNQALQALRKQKPASAIDTVDLPSLDDPQHTLEQADRTRLVSHALEQVPEACRVALILFYREGRSVREVASALELSEEAAKQRISRGRKHMRGQLEQLIGDELRNSKPDASFAASVMTTVSASVIQTSGGLQSQPSSAEGLTHGPAESATTQLRRGVLHGLVSPHNALIGAILLAVIALVIVAATYATSKTSQFDDEGRTSDGNQVATSGSRDVAGTDPLRATAAGALTQPRTGTTLTNTLLQAGHAGEPTDQGDIFAGRLVIAGTTDPCIHASIAFTDEDKLTTLSRAFTVTDGKGEFRLVGMPPGRYRMHATCREQGRAKARIATDELAVELPDTRFVGWPVRVPENWKTLRQETLEQAPEMVRRMLEEGAVGRVLSDEEMKLNTERMMDTDGDGTVTDTERRVYEELLNHSVLANDDRKHLKTSSYSLTEYRDEAVLEVPTEGHLSEGPDDAPVKIVTVIHTACPYSMKAEAILRQLRIDFPDQLRVVRRVRGGMPDARAGARAYCAAQSQQGGAAFLEKVWPEATVGSDFSEKNMLRIASMVGLDTKRFARDMSSRACAEQLEADTAELDELGLKATPTWVIGGQVVRGVRDLPHYRRIIEEKLASKVD